MKICYEGMFKLNRYARSDGFVWCKQSSLSQVLENMANDSGLPILYIQVQVAVRLEDTEVTYFIVSFLYLSNDRLVNYTGHRYVPYRRVKTLSVGTGGHSIVRLQSKRAIERTKWVQF